MSTSDFLTCPICLEVATNAVESECCTTIYCEQCAVLNRSCPTCRNSPFYMKPNMLARKMINSIPVKCDCGSDVARADLKEHQKLCPETIQKCTYNGCNFNDKTENFLLHLQNNHKKDLIEIFTQTNNSCFPVYQSSRSPVTNRRIVYENPPRRPRRTAPPNMFSFN